MPAETTVNHVFQHPWNDIASAFWRKYPTPLRPDVISIDLLDRKLDAESGVLTTRRLVTVKGPLPSWANMFIRRPPALCFVEEAKIDPRNEIMTLTSRNVTADSIVLMEETCVYRSHENKAWTSMNLDGRVTSYTIGISQRLEDFLVKSYKANSAKGREVMEQACLKIKQEAAEKLERAEKLRDYLKQEAEESIASVNKAALKVSI